METTLITIAAFGILYWSLWEYRKYKRPQPDDADILPYSTARFRRRMGVSIIILLILTMISARHYIDAIAPYRSMMIAYYGACMVLAIIMVLLALGDLAETGRQLREARKKLVEQSISELTAEVEKMKRKKQGHK